MAVHIDFEHGLGPGWEIYHSAGHAGWGLRRPRAVSVVDLADAGNGRALAITAEPGTGPDADLVVSGGIKLLGHGQTYGTYTVRVRAEPDPDGVTSAVSLLWPASNRWPDHGEINIFETWGSRTTRTPVESHLHWPQGSAGAIVDAFTGVTHDVDGTQWHHYTLEWRADRVSVAVDGGQPLVLSEDRDRIPHRDMDLTFQLDAFDTAARPGRQPALTGPVTFYVDELTITD